MTSNLTDFEITFCEGILRDNPNHIEALTLLAEAYTKKKLYDKGLELDKRLAEICPTDAIILYNLACSYALVGQCELSLESLEKAIKNGYSDLDFLRKDADLKILHEYPAFAKIMKLAELSCHPKDENL